MDLILDTVITPAYPVGYTHWINNWHAIEAAARQWYLEANGHAGAETDIAHGLWRGINECDRWKTLRNAFQDTWPKPGTVPPDPGPIPEPGVEPFPGWVVDGWTFRNQKTTERVRYIGVTGFGLGNKFRNGESIDGFLNDYEGCNIIRYFDHTIAKDGWGDRAWAPIPVDVHVAFINYLGDRGRGAELVLLTSDDPAYVAVARALIAGLKSAWASGHLRYKPLMEAANEPLTHKTVDVNLIKSDLENSGFLYCNGIYEDSDKFWGNYYVNHTARSEHFPRYSHDLYEAFTGQGPDKPHPAFRVPSVGDEPGKLQDVGSSKKDWRALFGGYAIMGAGGTFHTETGKFGDRPTEAELEMWRTVYFALTIFPADAPGGPYRRIVEPGNEEGGPTVESRTYIVGNYAVRSQQVGTQFPEPGWTSLDPDGVLWRR